MPDAVALSKAVPPFPAKARLDFIDNLRWVVILRAMLSEAGKREQRCHFIHSLSSCWSPVRFSFIERVSSTAVRGCCGLPYPSQSRSWLGEFSDGAGWQFCSLRSASLLASLFFGWYASPEWTVRTPPLARSRVSLPIQGAPKCATGPITASDRL